MKINRHDKAKLNLKKFNSFNDEIDKQIELLDFNKTNTMLLRYNRSLNTLQEYLINNHIPYHMNSTNIKNRLSNHWLGKFNSLINLYDDNINNRDEHHPDDLIKLLNGYDTGNNYHKDKVRDYINSENNTKDYEINDTTPKKILDYLDFIKQIENFDGNNLVDYLVKFAKKNPKINPKNNSPKLKNVRSDFN